MDGEIAARLNTMESEVITVMDLYRGLIMDALELRLQDREDWKQIRSQMLKLLGNTGLESRLLKVVRGEERNGNR